MTVNNGHNPMLDQLAQAAANAQPVEQGIPIGPVPTGFAVGTAQTPDGVMVILIATTALGPQHYFMPGEIAKTIGAALHQAGTAAASGLTIVGNAGDIPEPS